MKLPSFYLCKHTHTHTHKQLHAGFTKHYTKHACMHVCMYALTQTYVHTHTQRPSPPPPPPSLCMCRSGILAGLKEKWQDLYQQYQGLSVVTDTISKRMRKEWMEEQMRQIEKDIETIEKHTSIYVAQP